MVESGCNGNKALITGPFAVQLKHKATSKAETVALKFLSKPQGL